MENTTTNAKVYLCIPIAECILDNHQTYARELWVNGRLHYFIQRNFIEEIKAAAFMTKKFFKSHWYVPWKDGQVQGNPLGLIENPDPEYEEAYVRVMDRLKFV